MPMETDIPTVTGQNTEGLSNGNIIAIFFGILGAVFFIITLTVGGGLCRKYILSWLEKRRKSDQRSADASSNHPAEIPETSDGAGEALIDQRLPRPIEMSTISAGAPESEANFSAQSSNHPAEITVTSEVTNEALINQTNRMTLSEPEANISGSSPNQAELPKTSEEADGSTGGGDRQALAAENRVEDMATSDQTFYDIYLVSTSKRTPHFNKMKDMCERKGWKYTTPFSGKLGEPEFQSAEEAVLSCSHVVLLITKDDCSMKNGKYNMTVEMAFKSAKKGEIGGRVIPIRCCDEDSLPLRLGCLVGSTIDDEDLEERMIKTIDIKIRKKREVQCQSVSGAQV